MNTYVSIDFSPCLFLSDSVLTEFEQENTDFQQMYDFLDVRNKIYVSSHMQHRAILSILLACD